MYIEFSRSLFEFTLNQIIFPRRSINVTVEMQVSGNPTMEHIYEIKLNNPKVVIIIFSSIDVQSNTTRENGKDRVRLVMRWDTKKGIDINA